MLKIFWYRYFKYPTWMADDKDGIKSFTERRITENITALKNKISSLNVNDSVEVEHNPSYANINIPDNVYRDNKRRKNVMAFVLFILFLAEGFLNYISILIVVKGASGYPWVTLFMRLATATGLTIASIISLEQFFEAFLNEKFAELKAKYNIESDSDHSVLDYRTSLFISLFFLLIIAFIAEKRASVMEPGRHLAYYSLIMLPLILPIFGGRIAVIWSRSRKICEAALGKNNWQSQVKRRQDEKINMKSNFINNKDKIISDLCGKYWLIINDFKTVKLAFQRKQGTAIEDIGKYKLIVDNSREYQKFIVENLRNLNE